MCSVLWPRLKVDNGIKIFNVAGQMVWSTPPKSLTELWQAQWQGVPLEYQPGLPPQFTYPRAQYAMDAKDVYPDVDFTKVEDPGLITATSSSATGAAGAASGGAAKGGAAPAPGKYRHPHWSGQTRSAMTNEEEGPQKILASGASRPVVGGQKIDSPQQQQQQAQPQQRLPPGATPPQQRLPPGATPVGGVPAAGNAKQAAKNRARRQRKKANRSENGAGGANGGADDDGDDDE